MFNSKKLPLYLALAAALPLAGCGGGGGDSASTSDLTPTPTAEPTVAPSIAPSVEPSLEPSVEPSVAPSVTPTLAPTEEPVVALTSRMIKGEIDLSESSTAPTAVELIALDATGNQVDKQSFEVTENNNVLGFTRKVSLPAQAGQLVVNVSQTGFTSYSKTFDFETGTEFDADIRASLEAVAQVRVPKGNAIARSGKQLETFSFSVRKGPQGRRLVLDGNGPIPKNVGEEEIRIDIPAASLPANTTELAGRIANYDPSSATEAEAFPGAYRDSEGNTLVSVAFSFAEIRDQDGNDLPTALANARKAGEVFPRAVTPPTIIKRAIPAGSCSALEQLKDANLEKAGFQIPVYTYNPNAGDWDLLGYGDVFNAATDAAVPETQQVFDCPTDSYYLEVEVTNDDFNRDWWNLDYPLLFDEPVKLCANVKVQNENGDLVRGSHVFFSDNDGRSFAEHYTTTDANGVAKISTTLLDPNENDREGVLRYWGYLDKTYLRTPVTLSSDESCGEVQVLTVKRPDICTVTGKISRENGGQLNDFLRYVYAFPTDPQAFYEQYSFAQAETSGEFYMEVSCELEYEFYSISDSLSNTSERLFNVNGVVADTELSDANKAVKLKDITLGNSAPSGMITASEGAVENVFFDFDGDFPLTYQFDVLDLESNVVTSRSGTVEASGENQGISGSANISLDLSPGFYTIKGTVTDSLGKEGRVSGIVHKE
ncbi:PT domain-containing protein [Motilimonas eburnea]|uniref:PT domain-containing protein n=1 Tax=Motilimonas eburnea TaxID=1737488 RepID=UPI001E64E874|nr:PT domain-containing protein [Motilimonas eburnea]MCE2572684.1 PT domain-containing protein [Motilimonas eburnea]